MYYIMHNGGDVGLAGDIGGFVDEAIPKFIYHLYRRRADVLTDFSHHHRTLPPLSPASPPPASSQYSIRMYLRSCVAGTFVADVYQRRRDIAPDIFTHCGYRNQFFPPPPPRERCSRFIIRIRCLLGRQSPARRESRTDTDNKSR